MGTPSLSASCDAAVWIVSMQDRGCIGSALPRGNPGELHPLDRRAGVGDGLVDGHQSGVVTSRAGARREDEACHSCRGHGAIITAPPYAPLLTSLWQR